MRMKICLLYAFLWTIVPILCRENPEVTIDPFIVGGVQAPPHSWPSQVLINQRYTTDFRFGNYGTFRVSIGFQCAGTLLNKTHIMTAAHCISKEFTKFEFNQQWTIPIVPNQYYPTYESMYTLYAGAHDISFVSNPNIPIPATVKVLKVAKINIHPKYNTPQFANDIALFKITPEVLETREIKYAYLPQKSNNIPNDNTVGKVIGWGALSEGGQTSPVLMQVQLDVLNMQKHCYMYAASANIQLCIGVLAGGKSSCQGDSGGGFYSLDANTNRWMTVGIVSYAMGCARPGYPNVYTRVSAYIDWIRNLRV